MCQPSPHSPDVIKSTQGSSPFHQLERDHLIVMVEWDLLPIDGCEQLNSNLIYYNILQT